MVLTPSWVSSANDARAPFPLNNLPYGVFSPPGQAPRCGVAIGDQILDLKAAEAKGLTGTDGALSGIDWNGFMAKGPEAWARLRARLTEILAEASPHEEAAAPCLHPLHDARLHLPFTVTEFTDFYAGEHHARNVGTMFRGAENALPPNWHHMPIGYNGRASSVVVSGTEVRRPWGQIKGPEDARPVFRPSTRFDFELELGAIVGTPSTGPLSVREADTHIFGYVLLNDWSARDIQAWEYQPLGPFQSKATATTISPWIVTAAALSSFRVEASTREVTLLPHLADDGPGLFNIALEVDLTPEGQPPTTITRTNGRELYYSAAQQLAHHSSSGCPMRVGDLLGSGTISGPEPHQRGSMLELSWAGTTPLTLANGQTRRFLEDGDQITLRGAARGPGYTLGFGPCTGRVLPALAHPYGRAP